MPMSNLQRQLASLHGNSRSATYASTHHQIESIGRGYGYENQLGHTTVQSATKKDKSKPTLVYETSRAAADVPLITIRENAHKALQDLIHLLSSQKIDDESTFVDARARYLRDHAQPFFDHSTLKQERRLNTPAKNEEIDQQLCELLIVLGGCFDNTSASGFPKSTSSSHPYDDDDEDDTTPDDRAESSAITTTSTSHGQCILYMLEYLIRRYEIHSRSKTANQLLISFLPQHETILFGRLLQLIDLPMVDGNTWLFARRFAAAGSNDAPIVMTRQIIAQAMATPTNKGALLSNVLITTQTLIRLVVATSLQHQKVQKEEDEGQLWTMGQQHKQQQSQTPTGINHVLSFVGAIVSEALMHQAHNKTSSGSNSELLDEGTVRIVMPFVMDTLDSTYLKTCREYRHLGYVLIGILANCSILVKGAREVLATTMIKPITMTFQKQMKQHRNENGGDNQLVVASSSDPQSLLFRQRLYHDDMCQQLVDCFMVLNRLLVYGQREKETNSFPLDNVDDDGTTTSMIGSPSSSTSFVGIPLLTSHEENTPYAADSSSTTTTYLLGCSLPRSTYLALCQGGAKLLQDALNMAIGSSSTTEEDDYSFLLAAMVRYSITYMMEHTTTSCDGNINSSSQKTNNNGLRYGLNVFLALCGAAGVDTAAPSDIMPDYSDLQSIWFHRTNLTASVTILLIQEYMKSQSSTANKGNKDHDKKKKKKKKKDKKKSDSNEHTMDDGEDEENTNNEEEDDYYKTICLERCSKCLGALYKLDSDGCTRGIATIVQQQQQQTSSSSSKKSNKSSKKESHRLQRLIRRTFGGMFHDSTSSGEAGGEKDENAQDKGENSSTTTNETTTFMSDPFLKSLFVKKKHHSTQEEWANLLPPRVALDHPEEHVRLGAIQRIMIFKSKTTTPTAGDKPTADDDDQVAEVDLELEEDFPSLLLQRVVKDSSARVVAAAGKAYQFLVGQAEMTNVTTSSKNENADDDTSSTALCRLPTAREALLALERWGWLMDDRANDNSAEFTSPQTKKEMKRYHRGTASAHDSHTNSSMDAFTEDDVTALCVVIDLCALATDHSETSNDEYDLLILGIVGHLNCFGQGGFLDDGYDMNILNKLVSSLRNGYDQLQITISRALHRIVEHEEENNNLEEEEEGNDGNDVVQQTTKNMEEDIPMEVLLSTKDLFAVVLKGVLQSLSTNSSSSSKFHSILKRRFIRVMLSATVNYLEDDHIRPTRIIKSKRTIGSSKEKDEDAIVVDTCLDICFYLVQQYYNQNEESTTMIVTLPPDILCRCFKACMIKQHSLKQVLMMKLLKEGSSTTTTTLQQPGPLDVIAYFWNVIASAIPDPSLNSTTVSTSNYQQEIMDPLFPLLVTHVFDLKDHSINDQSSIVESAKETIVLELCTRSSNLQPFAIVTLLRFLKGNGGSYQQSFQQRHPLSSSSSQEDDNRYNSLRFVSLFYLGCGHFDRVVRSDAIEFLQSSTTTLMQTTSSSTDDGTILVRTIINVFSQEMKSKLVLDGSSNIMVDVLRAIFESKDVDAITRKKRQGLLLQLCTNVLGVDQQQQQQPTSPCTFYGPYHVCHWILQTLIQSGICDMSDMWTTAGKPILDYFRRSTTEHNEMISFLDQTNEEEDDADTLSSSWSDMQAKRKYDLLVLVVMILKGVVVTGSNTTTTSTDMVSMTVGPARGRSRSYSIIEEVRNPSTEDKKVTVLHPYPTSMMETILQCLQGGLNASVTQTTSSSSESVGNDALRRWLSQIVLDKIVASQTWSTLIFPNIPNQQQREQLLLLILKYREELNDPLAARALTVLPLMEDDFINLFSKLSSSEPSSTTTTNLLTMVYLCECISRRVPTMMDYTKLTTLMERLFSEFQILSKLPVNRNEEVATASNTTSSDVEYCRFCILKGLLDLGRQLQQQNVEGDPPSPKRKRSRSRSRSRSGSFSTTSTPSRGGNSSYTKFASMLLHVLELPSSTYDDKHSTTMIPLQTSKARSMAISLFLILCQLDPPNVGPLMLRALTNVTDLIVTSTTGVDHPSPPSTTTTLITSNAVSDIVRTYISLHMKWQSQSHSSSPSETAGVVPMNEMLASFSWHLLMPLYKAMDRRRKKKNKMRLNSNVMTTSTTTDAAAIIVSDEDDNTMEEDDVSDLLSDMLDQWIIPLEEATDTATATKEVKYIRIQSDDVGEALSSLCASLVAIESYYSLYEGTTGALDLLPLMIDKVLGMTSTSQVSTAFCLLRRVGNLIQALLTSKHDDDKDTKKEESVSKTKEGATKKRSNKKSSLFSMSTRALIHIACHDGNKEPLPSVSSEDVHNYDDEEHEDFGDIDYVYSDKKKRRCVMLLVTRLLSLGQNILFSTDVKTMIRRDDTSARMCFVLWRQLMYVLSQNQSYSSFLLQQSLQQKKKQTQEESDEVLVQLERSFWNGASNKMDECLLLLQRLLPVPHFLTSAMSVICDEFLETTIRRKALLLLVERAMETEPGSSECCLFLESIPNLLDIVCPSATQNVGSKPQPVSIQQSVLMTIERLARHLSSPYSMTSSTAGGGSKVVTKHESIILHDTLDRLSMFVSTTVESFVNNVNQLSSSSSGTTGTSKFDIKHTNDLQLMSSSLLCSATILGVLGPRALSTLKSMMKSIVQILKTISSYYQYQRSVLETAAKNDNEVVSLLLESTLRALTALFQAVPQFLGSYLNDLLQCTALGSSMLRQRTNDDDNDATTTSLKTQYENVEHAFATNIPVRQSCPAICNNLIKTIQQRQHDSSRKHSSSKGSSSSMAVWKDVCVLLRLLTLTIQNSTKADMSPVMSKSIGAIMTAATYHEEHILTSAAEEDKGRFEVLQSSSEALVALVMKLSESQLKPLFLRMREWKGDLLRPTKESRTSSKEDDGENDDFDEEDIMASSVRRYAFWTITARLTTEIRSLFLPCLSTVVTDLVDELAFASSMMKKKKNHLGTSSSKKKRRKLSSGSFEEIGDNDDGGEHSTGRLALEQLRPLQPVLLTLEAAMKADAHAGGGWIRVEDGTRFQSLLTPLSKLFLVHVPTDMPLQVAEDDEELMNNAETTNAYDKLIRGVGTLDYGNVVGCITAMATAVGNEQMWKPLNHAILSACGNEERHEVCKAGITALLTVLRTIGEEYMVLLPESLPVLSELLEHTDEDIASMAKECIELGEEMLGESFDM